MKAAAKSFALCIDNSGYQASLIPGKVYRILPDLRAAKDDLVRIVDESGEDYLYHKSYFVFVDSPTLGKTCWTPTRLGLRAWLQRNAPSLAELYEGAVRLMYESPLPGRVRF